MAVGTESVLDEEEVSIQFTNKMFLPAHCLIHVCYYTQMSSLYNNGPTEKT